MNLELFETEIIDLLLVSFPDFTVESFPINFKDYRFSSSKGCHLVKYNQTKFEKQSSVWNVFQECKISYSIVSGYRALSSYIQIHEFQSFLRNIIQGIKFEGKNITLSSEKFLAEINGDLFMELSFEIELFETENENYDEILI